LTFPKPFKPIITKYERKLWHALKKEGIPFTAQLKVATKSGRTYTVDIAIPTHLIVEVGFINEVDIQEHEDLRQTGYTVLHFPNTEIKNNIRAVIETIKKMRKCQNQKSAPTAVNQNP